MEHNSSTVFCTTDDWQVEKMNVSHSIYKAESILLTIVVLASGRGSCIIQFIAIQWMHHSIMQGAY